ncbi:MAG: hypothetical protein V4662_13925 [Verrucomicrobiota bacterium]
MKMTLHFLLKDLRATLPWWLVTLVLAVSLAVIPVRGQASENWSWNVLSFWLGWLLCLTVVLLQGRLLSLDPPEGAERFIGTRPVSGWQVVAGKAGVLALLGLLPLVLALSVRISRLGMDAGALRTSGILAQDIWLLTLVLGMLCLPHVTLHRNAWTGLAAMLLALVIFMFGNGLMFIPFAMDALPAITALGAVATGVMGGMLARYGRLSAWPRAGCIMLGVLLGSWMSYGSFGPQIRPVESAVTPGGDLTLTMDRPQQLLKKASAAVSGLALSLDARRNSVSTLDRAGGEVELRQDLQLRGLPEGVYADFESAGGFFQVAGEGEWREMRRCVTSFGWAVHPDAAFHAVPGNPGPTKEALSKGMTFYLPLGQAALPKLRRGDVLPVSLKGDAVFSLYRARLEKVLPIADGTIWSANGLRIALSEVHRSARQVQFMAEVDIFGASPHDSRHSLHLGLLGHGFFGLQNGAGTPARLNAIRGWTESHPLLRHQRFTEQISISSHDRWWAFPVTAEPVNPSAQETGLAIFGREIVGTVRVPFEFLETEINLK